MLTFETLCLRLPDISVEEIQSWIDNEWLRPEISNGDYIFYDIDEARIRLIVELRNDLGVHEDVMPLVLHLMDQLYSTRRQIRYLHDVIMTTQHPQARQQLRQQLDEIIIEIESEDE